MRLVPLVFLLLFTAPSCRDEPEPTVLDLTVPDQTVPDRPISEVLAAHAPALMDIDGVNSVGQGACDGEPCVSIGVVRLTPELRDLIPDRIEGYLVRIYEQGPVRAQ